MLGFNVGANLGRGNIGRFGYFVPDFGTILPPYGYVFLVDDDGAFLVDDDGALLLEIAT